MIEDTTFIVDLLRGDPDALTRLEQLEARNVPEKLSAITALELYEGLVQLQTQEAEKQAIRDVLRSKAVVPMHHEIARQAGVLSGELRAKGAQIDREDCIIAATALQADEPVLTRNVNHFNRIPELDVRTY